MNKKFMMIRTTQTDNGTTGYSIISANSAEVKNHISHIPFLSSHEVLLGALHQGSEHGQGAGSGARRRVLHDGREEGAGVCRHTHPGTVREERRPVAE